MRTIHIFLLLMLYTTIQAQNVLTPEKAVNIALKNNFDILIARNDADIARMNNTKGNAGMLPTVNVNGSGSYSYDNVYQKLSNGTVNKYSSQSSTMVATNTELSWTLFDGGRMFVTKNKLSEIQALGGLQFQAKVLETLYNVIAAYYDIVKQKQQLNSINEAINYNKERVTIAQIGFDAGSLLKNDLLQAKIDLNVAMENAINQQYAISEAQKTLNRMLGQDPNVLFEVSDSIPLLYTPDSNELLQKLNSSNASILSFQKQIDIARLTLKENQKAYLPTLSFKGGYYLSQTANSEGSSLKNRSYGPQVGGTLSIPLYNGGETKRKISIAKKELQSAEYDLENVKLQMNTELQNTLTDFENQQHLLNIEKDNNKLAKENMEISLQRLRLGQTTSLEVHQAQESYVQSFTRLINFEYNLKIAETKLKQLIASL
ncbi:TolC family protein [uncultured Bacteroides sp.]|uniref:TolC family protein n=1 Tax=uncultured Bacteroides sp. TaxID=162156 RepID=UPI002AAB4EFE|nr:TolC family protein [uncultured Bacteroides sp.]